jgi:2-oxoacid:acceptor oxidoreductase delta subunit (pyruvate/2-ketoisovalerate family)
MTDEAEMKDPVLPVGRPTVGSAGETGDWRTMKPVLYEEHCIKCYYCWIHCPEDTIRVETKGEFPYVDYLYCKGCGICVAVCPKEEAFKMEPE